ncbi:MULTISPECIES: glyoxalase [Bacillus cereus group]|uniref:glyoxalase n=1 Tax=Bacillus cereus group TaxID=86661 RepID=UPI00123AF709|nr:glyoxalase [Bacillus cereus]KAA6457049.1 glyoxalase [Bacillus cereus]KAB2418887.1 glyoxalase [Bacillus cereus]KAB2439213.1 glyoxalase [Bacillus cereus]KAB2470259.1 glyoxalase [Bacillus cereus]
MREAIEEFIKGLRESAVESRKDADKAFDSGDLGLSGFHKGQWHTFENTAIALEDILADHEEEEQ